MDVLPIKRILLVGAGRRVQLAEYFNKSIEDIHLYSYELSVDVPISKYASIIVGKSYKDHLFLLDIKEICDKYNIDLIIPCQDEACFLLSSFDTWESMWNKLVVSPKETCDICYDKLKFEDFFYWQDFYPRIGYSTPVIVKPRFGQSGKGVHKYTPAYCVTIDRDTQVMQDYVEGMEWTVDCYFDKDCKFVDAVPRKRLRVFEGEVISSVTEFNEKLYALCMHIGTLLPFRGPINMQFIEDKNGKFWLTEINARFGGGYTLSLASGMDVISLIYKDWLGKPFEYKPLQWKRGLRLERALQDFYFSGAKDENSN